MPKVFIALPTYSQKVHISTLLSLVQTFPLLAREGWEWHLHSQVGDALLPRCRSMLAQTFLDSEAEESFWIDDDVQWNPEDFIRLLKHPVDMVAGLYRNKAHEVKYPVNWPDKMVKSELGLMEAVSVPFGFTRVRRRVFEQMIEKCKLRKWTEREAEGRSFYEFFNYDVHSDMYWGEDFEFCNKWRGLGERVWVDPDCEMTHYGILGVTGKVTQLVEQVQEVEGLFDKALGRAA